LTRLIRDQPDLRVSGEAADGTTALAMILAQRCDALRLDIDIGARNGRGTLAAIRVERARLPGIMLSIYVETQYAKLALRSRANAYLSRHTPRRVAARDPPGGARRRLRRSGASSRRSRANP
jgi:DNA-binding NarL/FixJ family response regulator